MASIQVGDVVQLKSGGPAMTVQSLFDDGDVLCQWFSGSKLENGVFSLRALEIVAEPLKS